MLSLEEGRMLIKLARDAIRGKSIPKDIGIPDQRKGVFVSIYSYPKKELRGCIGFVSPQFSLFEAVQRAARSAAFSDPRFPPLRLEELPKVVFEVSVLEEPKPIEVKDPSEYLDRVVPGIDGLILENPPFSGLFLPQVWIYFDTAQEFLEQLCYKAGLTPDYIYHPNTRLLKFGAQVFAEQEPEGRIVELKGPFRKS
jgi:hypothetical protein